MTTRIKELPIGAGDIERQLNGQLFAVTPADPDADRKLCFQPRTSLQPQSPLPKKFRAPCHRRRLRAAAHRKNPCCAPSLFLISLVEFDLFLTSL